MKNLIKTAMVFFCALGLAACQLALPLDKGPDPTAVPVAMPETKPESDLDAAPSPEAELGASNPQEPEKAVPETEVPALPAQEPTPETEDSNSSANLDKDAQKMVDLSKKHLAEKLSIPVEQIGHFEVEAVSWPDSSLGCPKKGMVYSQVITDGYRILLEANGVTYSFHTDMVEQVILCDSEGPGEIYQKP